MSSSPSPAGIPPGAALPVLPAFDNTLGALLLGGLIAMAYVLFLFPPNIGSQSASIGFGELPVYRRTHSLYGNIKMGYTSGLW